MFPKRVNDQVVLVLSEEEANAVVYAIGVNVERRIQAASDMSSGLAKYERKIIHRLMCVQKRIVSQQAEKLLIRLGVL